MSLAWISSDYFESLSLSNLLRGENDSKQSDEIQAIYISGIWISASKKLMRNADWRRWH